MQSQSLEETVYEGPCYHDVYLRNDNEGRYMSLDSWSLPDKAVITSHFRPKDDDTLTSLIQRLVAARDWLRK